MGLNLDCVQWWAVMLAEFSLQVLLLNNSFIHYLFIYTSIDQCTAFFIDCKDCETLNVFRSVHLLF